VELIIPRNLPKLEGWLSSPVAAERLQVSRQRFYQMLQENKFTTATQVPGTGDRPAAILVREAEIDRLVAAQVAAGTEQPAEQAVSP
jgi:hypothetical protein